MSQATLTLPLVAIENSEGWTVFDAHNQVIAYADHDLEDDSALPAELRAKTLARRTNSFKALEDSHADLLRTLKALGRAIEHGDPQRIADLWQGRCARAITTAREIVK